MRRPELVFRIDVEGSDVVVISQGIYPRRFDGAMSGFMTRDPAERARAALDACVAAVLAVEVGALPCRQLGLVGGSFRRWRECRHRCAGARAARPAGTPARGSRRLPTRALERPADPNRGKRVGREGGPFVDFRHPRLQVLGETSMECFYEKKLGVMSQKTVTECLLAQRGSVPHVIEDVALAL